MIQFGSPKKLEDCPEKFLVREMEVEVKENDGSIGHRTAYIYKFETFEQYRKIVMKNVKSHIGETDSDYRNRK